MPCLLGELKKYTSKIEKCLLLLKIIALCKMHKVRCLADNSKLDRKDSARFLKFDC